jgi:hypothetical protein
MSGRREGEQPVGWKLPDAAIACRAIAHGAAVAAPTMPFDSDSLPVRSSSPCRRHAGTGAIAESTAVTLLRRWGSESPGRHTTAETGDESARSLRLVISRL